MTTTQITTTALEAAAGLLLIIGVIFEDRIAALEQQIYKKIFRRAKR